MDVQICSVPRGFSQKTTSKVAQHPWEIHQQHPVEVAKPYWPCPAPNSVPPNLEPALRWSLGALDAESKRLKNVHLFKGTKTHTYIYIDMNLNIYIYTYYFKKSLKHVVQGYQGEKQGDVWCLMFWHVLTCFDCISIKHRDFHQQRMD